MFLKLINYLNDLSPRGVLALAAFVFVMMFGVLYFFLSYWKAEDTAKEAAIPPTPTVLMRSVVVAKTDIPPLTVITAEMLQTKEIPEELAPADAIIDTSRIINSSSKSAIFTGDVITERKLFTDLKKLTFVGSIPPDCRAVSISVNEITRAC